MRAPLMRERCLTRRFRLFDALGALAVAACAFFIWDAIRAEDALGDLAIGDVIDAPLAPGDVPEGVAWQGIYLRDAKVGYAKLVRRRTADGYAISQNVRLSLVVMKQKRRLDMTLNGRLAADLTLRDFDMRLKSDLSTFSVRGRRDGNTVVLKTTTGGETRTERIALSRPPVVHLGIKPIFDPAKGPPPPGTRLKMASFDPMSMAARDLEVLYHGPVERVVMGEPVAAHHIAQRVGDAWFDAYVDSRGEVLVETLPMGLEARRETQAEATYGVGRGADVGKDLIEKAAIAARDVPDAMRGQPTAHYELSGLDFSPFALAGGRQTSRALPARGDGASAPVVLSVARQAPAAGLPVPLAPDALPDAVKTHLAPSRLIQSDSPAIVEQSRRLSAGKTTVHDVAHAMTKWTYDTLDKVNVIGMPSAAEVLQEKRGDCNEHAALSVALIRAAGVPARVAAGVVLLDGKFMYHAWTEYWDGTWHAVDAAWGQKIADVTHLRFVSGDLDAQLKLLPVLGRLAIRGLKAPPEVTPDALHEKQHNTPDRAVQKEPAAPPNPADQTAPQPARKEAP